MGNWFGRSKLMVKTLENDIGMVLKSRVDEVESRKSFDATSSPMRIKVRMTKTQLKELKAHADTSEGNYELGRWIVKECLEGRLSPHVVVEQPRVLENSRSMSLNTIDEERK